MRILIAEQHRSFRAEFVELVTECHRSWQIAETAEAWEVHARMDEGWPDLVFLDLELPGLDTRAARAALRAAHPGAKIVGLGDCNNAATIINCLEDGLGGYIARSCSGIKLLRTLRVIATPDMFISTGSGEPAETAKIAPHVPPAPLAATPLHMAPLAAAPLPLPREAELPVATSFTARQHDVLSLLAEGRSTKEIARRLGLAVPTVKTHLAAVYRQLGARNRLQAVMKAGALAQLMPNGAVMPAPNRLSQEDLFKSSFAAG